MANAAPTPKAVALVLVPALVLMLAFAFFYVGAFHEPTPHHVPLAVVGPPAIAAKLSRLPGRLCSSTARGSRVRFSCWWAGRPWVQRSRSRWAAAS